MMTAEQALRQFYAVERADIVADALLELGCHGNPGSCDSCPVALYLRRFTGRPWKVFSQDAVPSDVPADDRLFLAQTLPPSVRRFVSEFDAGLYPMLQQ